MGKNLNAVAAASIAFSASELVFFDSMASSIVDATLWLDQGLVAMAKMLGQEVNQDLHGLTLSLAKPLQFLYNSATILLASTLLKRRDAALTMAPKYILWKEKLNLRNSPLPREQVIDTNKHRKDAA